MDEGLMMRPKILIVDDRRENIIALEGILEDLDIELVTALGGNEAVAKTLRNEFALILMDVQMPEMDGFEALEFIRREKKNRYVPVIFLSAIYREDVYQIKGIRSGAVDFITKPLNEDILIGKIQIFLELYLQKRKLQDLNAQLNRTNSKLNRANEKLNLLANTDGLTGIANRLYFDESIKKEWLRSARNGTDLALLMIDIDYFKFYNDTYGHLQGDKCLQAISQHIAKSVRRPGDFIARYGGEEFAVVLTETDINGATMVGKNMRDAIIELKLPHTGSKICEYVTISIGITSTIAQQDASHEHLISVADQALYKAKEQGRNRWEICMDLIC